MADYTELCEILRTKLHGTIKMEVGTIQLADTAAADVIEGLQAELQAYKGAEEQGRLVVLPCKAGDKVYCIDKCFDGEIRVKTVHHFVVTRRGEIALFCDLFDGFICYGKYLSTFNRFAFGWCGFYLTREAAETKLKELEEKV